MNPLMQNISEFIDERPSTNTDDKPIRVRIFERKRSVGDFSISYRKNKENKQILEEPCYCFTTEKAIINGFSGYVIKKTGSKTNGNSDVFVTGLPLYCKLTTKAKRRILEVHFECDVLFVATGERRYKD